MCECNNHMPLCDIGDFSVSILVRAPKKLGPFHMLVSRRSNSDWLAHHQIFVDTRSTWVGKWQKGRPVAVFFMGGGNGAKSRWAHTAPLPAGDYIQLTFTVQAVCSSPRQSALVSMMYVVCIVSISHHTQPSERRTLHFVL